MTLLRTTSLDRPSICVSLRSISSVPDMVDLSYARVGKERISAFLVWQRMSGNGDGHLQYFGRRRPIYN